MASNKVLMLDRNFLVSILLSISCSLINSCKMYYVIIFIPPFGGSFTLVLLMVSFVIH